MGINEFRSEFGLGQLVYMNDCREIKGMVDSVRFGCSEAFYTVQWFNEGSLVSGGFYEWQLEPVTEN